MVIAIGHKVITQDQSIKIVISVKKTNTIMKRNIKNNLFGWLSVSMMLLTTACAGIADLDTAQTDQKEKRTVILTVEPESLSSGMRAATANGHISDGKKINQLIYAAYKKNPDGSWTKDPYFASSGNENDQAVIDDITYPYQIKLTIEDGDTYKVAFWAQKKGTGYYDTHDLEAVKVNYTKAGNGNYPNNDEDRDAFCAVTEEIDGTQAKYTATLKRPFAQVNVGTRGWDYEGAAILKPSAVSYTQSKITLDGVAQYYNVLNGEAIVDDTHHQLTKVTYDFNRLPAFIHATDDQMKRLTYEPLENEEYLKVDLPKGDEERDGKYDAYVGWDHYRKYMLSADSLKKGEKPATEEFKYLSMSYVLVPEAKSLLNGDDTSIAPDATNGAVLNSVSFEAKGVEVEGNASSGVDATGAAKDGTLREVFTLTNVPVQKNWRTNILGDGFFVEGQEFKLDVVPVWFGDYNYDGNVWGNTADGEWPTEKKTYNLSFGSSGTISENTSNFFTCAKEGASISTTSSSGKYNNNTFSYALKMEGKTTISFKTKATSTVIIVQSTNTGTNNRDNAYIKFNGVDYSPSSASTNGCTNARFYTIKDVPAGVNTISQSDLHATLNNPESGDKQAYIFYVEVQVVDIHSDTEYPNPDAPEDKDNPDGNDNSVGEAGE